MDLFEIPDDYKPEKPLTDAEADDITNYLKGHPLFLKEIPENVEGNEHLAALQEMIQEESPEERAHGLNKQANGRLKQGPNSPYYMRDAYQKYTEAIQLKPNDTALLAKLHCNRAMINLRYKNFGKVIEDCKQCIKIDPTYVKAYYRMAKAYISLKKYKECIDFLSNQKDADLKAVLKEAIQLKEKDEKASKKVEEKKVVALSKIEQYFVDKKWRLGKKKEMLPQGVEIQFIDDKISIPLVVIYPEFSQFDLIAKTGERKKLGECIKELFASPLPWDTKNDYNFSTIEVFAEMEEGVLMKLPKQATISDIAARVVVRGAIEIIIMTNNSFGEYNKKQYKII